jgi:hypothetical protein
VRQTLVTDHTKPHPTQLRGERYDPREVLVLGDTPGDLGVRASRRRAMPAGRHRPDPDVAAPIADADAVLPDLTDTDEMVLILTG